VADLGIRFEIGGGELALILVIVFFAFATWLPGLRETFHNPPPPGHLKSRWSGSDWALVGAAVLAAVAGLLALGLHRR
jgi:hypothetical protein